MRAHASGHCSATCLSDSYHQQALSLGKAPMLLAEEAWKEALGRDRGGIPSAAPVTRNDGDLVTQTLPPPLGSYKPEPRACHHR